MTAKNPKNPQKMKIDRTVKLYLKKTERGLSAAEQSETAWKILKDFGIDGVIKKNEFGKPYIENSPIKFNISHTDGAVAVALSDSEVGVDIQRTDIRKISDRVMRRFFGDIFPDDANERIRLWTELESRGKWLSCGIPIVYPDRPHRFFSYEFNGCMLSVCTDTEHDKIEITVLD